MKKEEVARLKSSMTRLKVSRVHIEREGHNFVAETMVQDEEKK